MQWRSSICRAKRYITLYIKCTIDHEFTLHLLHFFLDAELFAVASFLPYSPTAILFKFWRARLCLRGFGQSRSSAQCSVTLGCHLFSLFMWAGSPCGLMPTCGSLTIPSCNELRRRQAPMEMWIDCDANSVDNDVKHMTDFGCKMLGPPNSVPGAFIQRPFGRYLRPMRGAVCGRVYKPRFPSCSSPAGQWKFETATLTLILCTPN